MVRMIDILPNPVTQRAADQHDGAVIFVGDYGRQRPRLDAVTGWKRRSTLKEIAAPRRRGRTPTLSNFFEHIDDNGAVDERLRAEQSRLARAIVMLGSADKIERR